MKIIDGQKRHDYYDIGLGLGHDDSIIYIREPKDIEYSNWKLPNVKYRFETIHVGFCGKIYPAILFNATHNEKPIIGICYNIEEVDKFVHTYLNKRDVEQYDAPEKNKYRARYFFTPEYYRPYWGRKAFVTSFEKMNEARENSHYTKIFKEHNTPIFVVNPPKNKIHINCLLKPWEFYRVFDPYSAFQEISMYVGGVLLASTPNIPTVSDEIRAESHGFDKFSFRKEKTK